MDELVRDIKDYYKIKFLELLFSVTNAEMEGNIEKYVTGIKHVIRYSWKYLSQTDKQYINKQIAEMNEEIEKMKQDVANRNKIIDLKYKYYDSLFNYVLCSLLDSSIMEEENFAVITFEDEKELEKVSEFIRDKKLFKKLMEVKEENDISSL